MKPEHDGEAPITGFQLVVLLLSVAILVLLLADATLDLPPESSRLVNIADNVVCLFFIIDVVLRYRKTPNKKEFWKWGWIDVLASIPNAEFVRYGRLVRVLRLIQILRGVRSFQRVLYLIKEHKFRSGFGAIVTTFCLVITFSSISILTVETSPDSNIRTAQDAVWWSVVTVTTVGYGDSYPVTPEGRIIAALLMITGAGLFGTLSGVIASSLVGAPRRHQDERLHALSLQMSELQKTLDELRHKDRDK